MSVSIPTTVASNGAAPAAPAALYIGEVMHARLKPVGHRFTYAVFTLLVDVDRLSEADRLTPLFRINRAGLVSLQERDFGDGKTALSTWARDLFAKAGLPDAPSRIVMLCYPRVLGFVFNPITVFFGLDETGTPIGVIYEVRNTFGEKHCYVAPVEPGHLGPEGLRQERDKLFYVSPFMDMPMRYRFRVLPPGEGVRVRILETDQDGPILSATFVGRHAPMTTAAIAKLMVVMPAMTLKVIGGIHWEALKLWFKGIRFFHRPAHPGAVSFRDGVAEPAPPPARPRAPTPPTDPRPAPQA